MDDEAEAVIASITVHYAVGNDALTAAQFGMHLEDRVCPACDDALYDEVLASIAAVPA